MKTKPPPPDGETDQSPPATGEKPVTDPNAAPPPAHADLPPSASFRETIYYWLMVRP